MAKAKPKAASKAKPKTRTTAKPKPAARSKADEYKAKKRADNARSRAMSEEARDVGPLPPVKDPARRERCGASLLEFCRTYYPAKFYLPFSPDHLAVVDRLERCVRGGGLFAVAMPRGSGKSELCKRAAEWAVLYGHRRLVALIGSTESAAEQLMDDIKAMLAGNDLLAEDFPEACRPVRALEGIAHRAKGQLLDGRPTRLVWKQTAVRLAAIPGSPCAGAVIRTAGLTGAIRGLSATAADGATMRPDLVLLDDPQTRESASSPTQTAAREAIIRGDVLGLAGPTRSISAIMPCTVVYRGDLADRFLDQDRNPQWQGVRTALVKSFPADADLWDRYFEIRAASFRAGGDGREATEFYRENRGAMDAGAVLAWPERYDAEKYASALEEAMVKRHENPAEFAAEYQNAPEHDDGPTDRVKELAADDVAVRTNLVPRGVVPRESTRLTAFVDVGAKLLWWGVVGWDERFNGAVIDYGAYPPQPRPYFTAAAANPTLADQFPGMTEPQFVFAGLRALTDGLCGRTYARQDTGEPLSLELVLIDSGWLTDVVHQAIRRSPHAALLFASRGYATSSNARPIDEWAVRPGERAGRGWRLSVLAAGRGRQVTYDPDVWKSFLADRLTTPEGGTGSLTLFGDSPRAHQLLADHLTAEFATRVTTRGRTFDKWETRPDRRDNHLLDVLTGCAVAASVRGLVFSPGPGCVGSPAAKPARRPSLGERMAAKGGAADGAPPVLRWK